MIYQERKFYLKRTVNGTQYYSCATFRVTRCAARLIVSADGNVKVRNDHTCAVTTVTEVVDVTEEMRESLEKTSTDNLTLLPSRVYTMVVGSLKSKYVDQAIRSLTREQALRVVYGARSALYGGDMVRAIEHSPLCNVSTADERPFLQFNTTFVVKNTSQRITGFAHPELMGILKYPGISLFIDGTFKICPKPYYQVIIVMAYEPNVDLYVPIFYVLTTGKCDWSYWNIFNWLKTCCGLKLAPKTITCDFERALINGVRDHFPQVTIVGCLFHWKQAIRRKLIDLRIPAESVSAAMKPGVIDVLTLVPYNEIKSHGIPYVRSKIDEVGHKGLWNTFWNYFTRTWMTMYDVETWNVSALMAQRDLLTNRTNNPLESYNHHYQDLFPTKHPNLLVWLDITKEEAIRKVEMVEDVKKGRRQAPSHADAHLPMLPSDYPLF
jgi:hypothetical protein